MGKSVALWAYLLAAGRQPATPAAERVARPKGRLVWLHAGQGSSLASLAQLAQRLFREDRALTFLLTGEAAPPALQGFPKAAVADTLPPDLTPAATAFLAHWSPQVAVLAGSDLPPALICATSDAGIPLLLVDARVAGRLALSDRLRAGMTGSLLARFTRLLAQDAESATGLRRRGAPAGRIEVAGRIEETTDPLTCNEAEREALARLLHARPVWLAMACPEAEEEAVIAAHAHAMQMAHRMLLILVPADPARGAILAERLSREGWVVARRQAEQEPETDVQAYVADSEGELGLWYRLAPMTFMGGTLLPGGSGRNPFEPAALGSAILHGPHLAPYPDAYGRLAEARATRCAASPEALTALVGELMAPDRAALLAHNAWAVTSGGAEVTERVMLAILQTMAALPPKAA